MDVGTKFTIQAVEITYFLKSVKFQRHFIGISEIFLSIYLIKLMLIRREFQQQNDKSVEKFSIIVNIFKNDSSFLFNRQTIWVLSIIILLKTVGLEAL